ncbi:glycoside hydrolase family 19 protein, partial [Arthrobacter sp. E3]|uniref:glycoside hydrolase family 19 protein n=1 Tax=Arthrobacter sp. E3 TaxID=517402 RepID=UPI002494D660
MSEQTFNEMFSRRSECKTNNFYTYDAFVTAAKSFPAFGTTGDIDVMKREIAAFLAQTAFQTAGDRLNDA